MNKFAERLSEILKVKELSQSEFARKLNTTHTCVNRWCKGVREPNFDTLMLICKELEETSDYLLGLED